MEKINSTEIIKALDCLIGETEPTGDSDEDRNRLENTYKLCDVANYCIERLCDTQSYDLNSRISDVVENTLRDIWSRLLDC